jgi:acyl-CoA synthetase (AMP-forming)/AMP-acid ligase II
MTPRRSGARLEGELAGVAEMTIAHALTAAAGKWAERRAISVVDTDQAVTFAELDALVGEQRAALEAAGLEPGDRVGLLLRNGLAFPIAWLAVIAAGGVAVPLNPRYTAREAEYVLLDTGAEYVVAEADLVDLLPHDGSTAAVAPSRLFVCGPAGTSMTVVAQPELEATTARASAHRVAKQDDLVSIQFTSGTTGLPKGCLLTHSYWMRLGASCAALAVEPTHVLGDHPFYYMQNQMYLAMTLACGAELHVTPGLSRRNFLRWLVENDIDFAWVDQSMLDLAPSSRDRRHRLRFAPGDGITPELHLALEARFGMVVREWYGSTEVGTGTYVPWDRTDTVGSGSMGWCAPFRESKIVDDSLNEVAPGEVGELCFRGPGMMSSYHNHPDVNADLFLRGGWFRTGDLCRKAADGQHYFIGRTRDMIRRSGESIAAAEVEQQILTHPGVAEVAVIAVPDQRRGEEAKAIVVVRSGHELSASDLADWCRPRLARFKIPRYVEFRTSLPRTSSGKIHKAELKAEDDLLASSVDLAAEEVQS